MRRVSMPTVQERCPSLPGFGGVIYRCFTPQFSEVAAPLTDLTKKKMPDQVRWTNECEMAFQELKEALVRKPILAIVDPDKEFTLQTDASEQGLGAVLSQEGQESPIAYASWKLQPRGPCMRVFYTYLYGHQFKVQTDHQPLAWLHRMKNSNARLTRWVLAIQPYTFELAHCRGQANGNADGLLCNR